MLGKRPTCEDLQDCIGKTVYAGSMLEGGGQMTLFASDKALTIDTYDPDDIQRGWDFVHEYPVPLTDQIRAKVFG